MNIVDAFKTIAHIRHAGQRRKYDGAPYTDHTDAVAEMYAEYFPNDLIGQAAAHGHDLIEDTGADVMTLLFQAAKLVDEDEQMMIPTVIVSIVGLSDVYTSEKFPLDSRTFRKAKEAIRLGGETERVQNVKVCDLINNTSDIVRHDPKFAPLYLSEKIAVLGQLKKADKRLRARAMAQILMAQKSLGIIEQAIVI
jgi:hypothetical protein